MKVLVKGKSCNIYFSEKDGGEFLKDMLSPVEESSINLRSNSTDCDSSKAENGKINAGVAESDIKDDMSKGIVLESNVQANDDRISDREKDFR